MEEVFPNQPNTPAVSFDLNIFEFDDEMLFETWMNKLIVSPKSQLYDEKGRLQVGNEEIQSETWETIIMETLNSSKRKADEEIAEDKKRKEIVIGDFNHVLRGDEKFSLAYKETILKLKIRRDKLKLWNKESIGNIKKKKKRKQDLMEELAVAQNNLNDYPSIKQVKCFKHELESVLEKSIFNGIRNRRVTRLSKEHKILSSVGL
ncbi:hypothetical protein PVK06_023557 [Gossypium arboreum]|uniref:Uncharacterized protein n=1 Tax=Gossypium arboreum TaxID=29729 RepID=A0ABR0PBF1_GOSAR|nr:hypothetical protein PVK06_023557 [Gossypium arboreum]